MRISYKVFFLREEFAKASCSFMDDADYEEGEKITVKYKNGKNTKFFKFPTFNITQQWKDNSPPFVTLC